MYYVMAKVKVKFCIVQVDYITLLCQETIDDALNLKCEACILSVTVLLFCVVYRNNCNRSIILLGFLPAQHFRTVFKDASV
jgi:hypothetical protein